MKRNLLLVLAFGVLLAGCGHKSDKPAPDKPEPRQLINALPVKDRPYVAIYPHASNKLITLLFDKKGEIKNISTEIEYLSGNALKGARSSINTSTFPYSQAFLLGSCSAGGKCSFDTNITTGTIKTKFELGSEIHVLKSNYVFLSKDSESTSDQKMSFKVSGKQKVPLVLSGNHGFPGSIDRQVVAEPVSILSSGPDVVKGSLKIMAEKASKAWVYDGSTYIEKPFRIEAGFVVIELDMKPREKRVMIVRDDLKGASEEATLYTLGPVVLTE